MKRLKGSELTSGPVGNSPFFWWVKALLLAVAAVALFPLVFAVAVRVFRPLLE
jgi:hypothetical protein